MVGKFKEKQAKERDANKKKEELAATRLEQVKKEKAEL